MSFGDCTADAVNDVIDEKASTKKSRQLSASEMNAFWSSSTLSSKSLLPISSPDQPQRMSFAENFRIARKMRCIVSAKSPPPVVGLLVGSEDTSDSIDAMAVSIDATLCAFSSRSRTKLWSLASNPSVPSNLNETGASNLYNSMFLPQTKHQVELATGHGTTCLDFAPDSPILLSGSSRGQISLWSVETTQRIVNYTGLTSRTPVWDLRWSPAAMYFSSVSADAVTRVWRSDIPFPVRAFPSVDNSIVHLVRWHPSCQLIAVGSEQHLVVYEISSGAILFEFDFRDATAIEFSPTGYLLSASNHESLSVWELNTGSVIFQADCFSRITSLAWSYPSGSGLGDGGLKSILGTTGVGHPILVSVDEDGKLRLWDRLFMNRPSVCELSIGRGFRPLSMHFTPKNLLVVAGAKESSDGSVIKELRG
jgi:WD40 repeat protein